MPNYRPAVPLISNHNMGKTSPQCKMGKQKQLFLNIHKYKTTFTLTTKIVLRFSTRFHARTINSHQELRILGSDGWEHCQGQEHPLAAKTSCNHSNNRLGKYSHVIHPITKHVRKSFCIWRYPTKSDDRIGVPPIRIN